MKRKTMPDAKHPPMPAQHPRIGMLATVRNRRAIITAVEPSETTTDGRIHLVHLEYTDSDGKPDDTLIWEREGRAELLEPTALPRVSADAPMASADFEALARATRWSALTPFTSVRPGPGGDGKDVPPIASPFFGAVQTEDFQLVPLLRALRMPRISLLLADDVGLGKTIEAGLILTELILRRRIRRILILCPASLCRQWHDEMKSKFSLSFDIVTRTETQALYKRMSFDANPWRAFPRIIASYYYLRQPDVIEQLRAASEQPEGSARLPWDLLVVDEAHNLMPAAYGDDSDLSDMLARISPWFEHKIFLSATPHNGYTRCFSGLLSLLDPVRFHRTGEFRQHEKWRAEQVVVRRLKKDINADDAKRGRMPRFPERHPEPLPLFFSSREKALAAAFHAFRQAVKSAIARRAKSEQLAGSFAIEVLNKRLLSCPYAFADSWYRFKEGIDQDETAELTAVVAARRAVAEDIADDREAEGRARYAARTVGAWLKPLAGNLAAEIAAVDNALAGLALVPGEDGALPTPGDDVRFDRLLGLIKERLRIGTKWLEDERLIVFTEYKTTLDYIEGRLTAVFRDPGVIRSLYGGMPPDDLEAIKAAFNDPDDPVRILVATDAASEGQNFQETARYVLHLDIPWNPARLDQRNGRLDRHGQARDVTVFHFTSEDDADLQFLDRVVSKVHQIREDLGSMGEVFDEAFQRRFADLADTELVIRGLDAAVEDRKGKAQLPVSEITEQGENEKEALNRLAAEIDFNPETLEATLETALGMKTGHPRLEPPDNRGRHRLAPPVPPDWDDVIDATLRRGPDPGHAGALLSLVFDPGVYLQYRNERPVFRPMKDTALMHLGHPMLRHALALFARSRFPGAAGAESISRWVVRFGPVPKGADALVLLTVEELAVNDLREPFHHWVRTIRIPVLSGRLGEPLPHVPAAEDRPSAGKLDASAVARARTLFVDVERDLKEHVRAAAVALTTDLTAALSKAAKAALADEKKKFDDRLKEVEADMSENSMDKLRKEIEKRSREIERRNSQFALFEDMEIQRRDRVSTLERDQAEAEEELTRRRTHFQDLVTQLQAEKKRVIERLIPARYGLHGQARVFPVLVEIRLPEDGSR